MTAATQIGTRDGAEAAVQAIPARPASRTPPRLRAGIALLGVVALFGVLCLQSSRYRDDPYGRARPPFKLDGAAWRSLLTVAATTRQTCPASVPIVALYVNSACPHCRAEMRRWADMIASGASAVDCIGFAVVAAASDQETAPAWLPPVLAPMLVWDHDGTVAHALAARFVPVTAYVTPSGVAVARVVGEATDQSTLSHLNDLRRASADHHGAP